MKPVLSTILVLLIQSVFPAEQAMGTSLLAVRESENCAGCHTGGRSQRPVIWRRCTLDCQGCHIDPSGAGPRNQWGYYYANDQMAMVNIVKPIDPLKDDSFFDIHYDGRMIYRAAGEDSRFFPMASEVSLRLRPIKRWVHFTYQKLFLGRIGDARLRPGARRTLDRFHLMIDELPLNLYAKVGRTAPVYGIRRPNHSTWIRERIGLDPFAVTDNFTFGGTLNVPYIHVSTMQGDPDAEEEDKQKGQSAHAGLRGVSFGWNVNGSYWATESESTKINMQALGLGGHVFGVLFYGERNWRTVKDIEGAGSSTATRLHPSSTISDYTVAYTGVRGLMLGLNHETMINDTSDSRRTSAFIDVRPIPYLQFELWRRFESGTRTLADTLAVMHLVGDF